MHFLILPQPRSTTNYTFDFPPSENNNNKTKPFLNPHYSSITHLIPSSSRPKQTNIQIFRTKHVHNQPALLLPQAPPQSTSALLLEQRNHSPRRSYSLKRSRPKSCLEVQEFGYERLFLSGRRRECFIGSLNQRLFHNQGGYERTYESL